MSLASNIQCMRHTIIFSSFQIFHFFRYNDDDDDDSDDDDSDDDVNSNHVTHLNIY